MIEVHDLVTWVAHMSRTVCKRGTDVTAILEIFALGIVLSPTISSVPCFEGEEKIVKTFSLLSFAEP